jgi:hypothetical protein
MSRAKIVLDGDEVWAVSEVAKVSEASGIAGPTTDLG